jgi:hypothetical protein
MAHARSVRRHCAGIAVEIDGWQSGKKVWRNLLVASAAFNDDTERMPELYKPRKRVGRGNPVHYLHMPVCNGGVSHDASDLVWGARLCRRLEVEYCVHSCDTSWNYITIGVFVAMTNFANGDFSDSQISKLSANPHVKPNVAWFLWRLP